MKKSITTVFATMVAIFGYSQDGIHLPLTGGTIAGDLTTTGTISKRLTLNSTSADGGYITLQKNGIDKGYIQWNYNFLGNASGNNMLITNTAPGGSIAIQTMSSDNSFKPTALVIDGDGNTTFAGSLTGTSAHLNGLLNTSINTPGYAAKYNISTNSIAYHAFQVNGADKGYLQWNSNITGTGAGTEMFINNIQGRLHLYDNSNSGLSISDGKVGIGTATPGYKIDVNGDGRIASSIITNSNSPFSNTSILYSQSGMHNLFGVDGSWTNKYFGLKTDGTFITMGGNVGIGTTTPDSKLTVAGKIHSQEVKVTIDAGADFVFEKDYHLKPLAEVAAFITTNKHLPEIASASDMKENGLELGEMNIKLLQKVEELTLHLIEQDKRLKKQEKLIELLISKQDSK